MLWAGAADGAPAARALATGSLALLAASAWLLLSHPRPFGYKPHELEITAIDIGQGDSFLLVTPNGHTLLLDSGGLLGMTTASWTLAKTWFRRTCGSAG